MRALRARLDLDSGYLSRLLRSLEGAGLVTVGPTAGTAASARRGSPPPGRAERDVLDRRSDELAARCSSRWATSSAARLVAAMAEVERLLTAALVEIAADRPGRCRRPACLARVLRRARPAVRRRLRPRPEHPRRARRAAAAGGPVPRRDAARRAGRLRRAEVPRRRAGGDQAHVGVTGARGLGVGRRLLAELERAARRRRRRGTSASRRTGALTEAIALYRSAGYVEVARVQRRAVRAPLVREAARGLAAELAGTTTTWRSRPSRSAVTHDARADDLVLHQPLEVLRRR